MRGEPRVNAVKKAVPRGRIFARLSRRRDNPCRCLSTEPGRPVNLGITAAMIRAETSPGRLPGKDRQLLAALGIELDEVRRLVLDATSRAWTIPPCGRFTALAPPGSHYP